jgi:hypothetical protein
VDLLKSEAGSPVECERDGAKAAAFFFIYSWGPRGNMPGAMSRKGQRCRLLARGSMNSALIEFEDGFRAVVSRNALRRNR